MLPAKSFSRGRLLPALALLIGSAAGAAAAEPALVHDFAPDARQLGIEPQGLTAAGGRLYFAGTDAANGLEPWTSDGSSPPQRLGDLRPGTEGSNPGYFTELGDAVVFHAHDASGSSVLYRHDGQALNAIARFESTVERWTKLGSLIYFMTGDHHLYRTDGTSEATVPVADLLDGASCPTYESCLAPEEIAAFEGALYFSFGGQLYRLPEGGAPAPFAAIARARGFKAAGPGRLVFQGCGPGNVDPCGAWATNGTADGTLRLGPLADGTGTAGAHNFLAWRGRVYFNANAPVTFAEQVFSTDGTPAGTRREPGFLTDSPTLLAATPGHLFYLGWAPPYGTTLFAADAAGAHRSLGPSDSFVDLVGTVGERLLVSQYHYGSIGHPGSYRLTSSDGDPAGTFDLFPRNAEPGGALLGGRLYFTLDGQLMRSDGSAAGTRELTFSLPYPDSGRPLTFPLAAELLVEAADPQSGGAPYLWRVDPRTFAAEKIDPRSFSVVAAGRQAAYLRESPFLDSRLFAYRDGAIAELPASGLFAHELADDDHLFFLSETSAGLQLQESDGTAAGTRLLADLGSGCSTSGGYCLRDGAIAASGGHVFFHASGDGGRLTLWDRAAGEKRTLLASFELAGGLLPLPGGRIAFLIDQPADARSWWTSDGTVAGTRPYFTLPAGEQLIKAVAAGERIFFQAYSSAEDAKSLWVSDLTAAGTLRLFEQEGFALGSLTAAGRNVFFATGSAATGNELGFSDGTPAGTRLLDLRPGAAGSVPTSFAALADGRLAFAADADAAGYEAWISDGSREGTHRLTDLNPGGAASPSLFAQDGVRLYFQATDGRSGFELWALDLPSADECRSERLCFHGGRFAVEAVAHAPDGDFAGHRAVAGEQSGVISFFSADNWELMVKVLDGCRLNGRYWVFAAAATDLAFELKIRDRSSGAERTYRNTAGQPARAITDTEAFPCGAD